MEMRVWRADISAQRVWTEDIPAGWERLGGRGLVARILLDEVPGGADPLGPSNKLIWAPGLLVGHMVSSCDRISVGGKSPLTGGVKESNAGGTTGLKLVHLGIKALIVQGDLPASGTWLLHLDAQGGRVLPADDLAGMGVYATAERLRERYGDKVAMALIGPAGEMRLAAASITNLDKDHVPSRKNGRGGMGALMGARRLKAVIIDSSGGTRPPLLDAELFKAAQKLFTKEVMAHPQTAVYRDYGTASLVALCQGIGALPTRNFSAGTFEKADEISGETLRDVMLARPDSCDPSTACMPGCTIRSSNVFGAADGTPIVTPLEFETMGLMGSNLGIGELEAIGRLNHQINDIGLDSIDGGAALGVAAEAGLFNFGDVEAASRLLEEIREGTPLGRILGNGAAITGKVLGVRRVPVAKGQAMASYDPRALKGTGVTYATSPMGADHTAGLTIRAKVDHLDPTVQADLSRAGQINMAGYDSLGACIFSGFGFTKAVGAIRDLINGRYGWGVGDDYLQVLGRATLEMELEFNRSAGFTSADDRLPEWMTTEPLPPRTASSMSRPRTWIGRCDGSQGSAPHGPAPRDPRRDCRPPDGRAARWRHCADAGRGAGDPDEGRGDPVRREQQDREGGLCACRGG
jgi:aldehyde:ferredoxin oxidoreductase